MMREMDPLIALFKSSPSLWSIFCGLLFLNLSPFPTQSQDFTYSSPKEFVLSVSDLDQSLAIYQDYFGFSSLQEGQLSNSLVKHWGLDERLSGKEVLLSYNGKEQGMLRLIEFEGAEQEYIRHGSNVWDTGGVFDLDIRVKDIHQVALEMRKFGFVSLGRPYAYKIGPYEVWEAFLKGPDDIVVALVERIQPPLDSLPDHGGALSTVFNVAQIVSDYDRSRRFFVDQLGFSFTFETLVKNEKPGENLLNIPYNLAHKVPAKVMMLSPSGDPSGLLEILQFEGLEGHDFSSKAHPPNWGIVAVRIAVEPIENFLVHLKEQGIVPIRPLSNYELPPYGTVKGLVIESPDGVWYEFFEKRK